MNKTILKLIVVAGAAVLSWSWFSGNACAQDETPRQSELAARQRLVERKMAELEEQFTVIAARLQEQEPERAQRLVAAYQQAKESLITRKMAEVSQFLDQGKLNEAEETLRVVIGRLDDLVKLLLENQHQRQTKEEQIAQWEQWKNQIDQLRREQSKQRRETEKFANKDQELERLESQLRRLDELIDRQTKLMDRTKQASGLRELDKVADQQFELRKETEDLIENLSDPANRQPSSSGGSNADGPESKSDGDAADGNSPDSNKNQSEQPTDDDDRPAADSENEPPLRGDQPSNPELNNPQGAAQESDPAESQSGSQSQAGSQSQSGSSDQQSRSPSQSAPQPGQQSLQRAAKAQERAEDRMSSGRADEAQQQQQQAIAEMQQARSELKKEQRRLASLPPEATEKMAVDQRRTRDKALELVDKMSDAPAAGGDDQQQVSQTSSQQPGQQQVEQAADAMQAAAQKLQDQDAGEAGKQQAQAQQKLDEALEEIEERLNQLREETRDEKLQRLESRFNEMLQRQQSASAVTIELDDKLANLGPWQHRDQLVLMRLAAEELEIGELGKQAYDLLLEDGTSNVLPELVQDLIDQLQVVAGHLQNDRTGPLTQLLQQEIESALQDLLESLEESKDENQQGGGGGGGGGDQPLLKLSAELKMLRAAQFRLHRKTQQLDAIKRSQPAEEKAVDREIQDLSGQQQKLQVMAEQLMEKQN